LATLPSTTESGKFIDWSNNPAVLGKYEADAINRIKPNTQKEVTRAHTTLKMLLKMTKKVYLFSRRNRYSIASVLASSLLELQNSNWLAESLGNESIVFHIQPELPEKDLLANGPYVEAAFFSKSKAVSSPSMSPPSVQQDRYATRNAIFK
jgi:hypothetical protein